MNELIPQTGNYKMLLSYQKTDVIYQITFDFCNRFLTKGDRTIDQMVQADYLLFRQLERLSQDFIKNGGFSERMTALRKKQRGY